MSNLFYSGIYPQVQLELQARGRAGASSRTTRDIAFMLEKVANVELRAYDKFPTATSIPISILGGRTVREGSFLPTGPSGYLNRPANRPGPYIKDMSVSISDNKGFVNKLTVKIIIPDPSALITDATGVAITDFDYIESIYLLPGRDILAVIAYPESAVISDPTTLPTVEQSVLTETANVLKLRYPTLNETELKRLNKLNELYFHGKISAYSFEYTTDGMIELSVDAIGTTNTYADISMLSAKQEQTTTETPAKKPEVGELYTIINDIVNEIKTQKEKQENTTNFEYLVPADSAKKSSRSILVGTYYKTEPAQTTTVHRMITLGYLIDFINSKILSQLTSEYGNIQIVCEDIICKSNYYEQIVSINSDEILLWPGKSNSRTNFLGHYGKSEAEHDKEGLLYKKLFPFVVNSVTDGFLTIDSEGNAYANPARIYINLEQIRLITTEMSADPETATVKKFLMKISDLIFRNTAGAIDMRLVQDSQLTNTLLFYDTNFIGAGRTPVSEFNLPAYASVNGSTVVRDIKLTSKIPENIRSLVYKNLAEEAGTDPVLSYIPYFFALTDTERKMQTDKWKVKHDEAVKELNLAKSEVASKVADAVSKNNLTLALKRYLRFFDPDIRKCNSVVKPPYPMSLEFTLDGINGLKFGDVLSVSGLPKRYSDNFVFCIQNITHTVSNAGEWTTAVTCFPRVRIKDVA